VEHLSKIAEKLTSEAQHGDEWDVSLFLLGRIGRWSYW